MADNTAKKLPEFTPAWGDLDHRFQTVGDKDLRAVFDDMASRQLDMNIDLATPCVEAQELLDQWKEDDEGHDYTPMWRAAVARRQPKMNGLDGGRAPNPEFMNDAEVLGTEVEGFTDFLNKPATLMLGEMWGARDRRNTLDEHWNNTSMTWIQWINGGAGNKNAPTWGFSRHPVGKDKAGHCVVLGSSVGRARKAKAMSEMAAMGLDIDSGAKLDDVIAKVEELGLFCLVYTSWNHNKTGLQLKRDDVLRKLQIKTDPSITEIRRYLRDFDKNRYEESFIAGCTIKSAKKQVKDGVVIELDTPPLEKFRLIFPLEESVKIIDLAETHEAALAVWEDKITGLAQNVLGIHFDVSATDSSRLFYTARHAKGSDNHYSAIIMGKPLAFEDVPAMKKSAYTSKREVNAFTMAGDADDDRPAQTYTPSGKSLNDWHRSAKDRLMLAELLETLCSDRIRHSGGEAQGHVHTECPFESEHTSEGGTGTMAINCLDSQNEFYTWFCHHDSCQGRHKLQFVEEALRQGWFDEDALFDTSHGFLLEGEDEEDTDPFVPLSGDLGDASKTPLERAEAFTTQHSEATIYKFIKGLHDEGVDKVVQGNVTAIIAKNTSLTKPDVKKFWRELDADKKRREREEAKAKGGDAENYILTTDPAPEQTQYAINAIKSGNYRDPFLFEYMDEAAIVRKGRIKVLDRDGRSHQLGKVTAFHRPKGDGETQHIFPPFDVVNDVFSADLSDFLLPLRGSVDTPFFAADGTLVTQNGYHGGSQIVMQSDLVIDRVSDHPTQEEARDAARYIVEEVLADFPLGGLNRDEIMGKFQTPDGVPAIANAMALILLPFARAMISGPTPGHIVNKPAPGTGAGFLVDVCTTIGSGEPAPALPMPTNKEELGKTLGAVLRDGERAIFFDNINHSVDSPELAAAMTAPATGYKMRILGTTETAIVQIMAAWVFAANTLTMSGELLRRCILIDLDRRHPTPGAWTPNGGWRHKDVREWTRGNRARLVHACLTIIQRWVAEGMQKSDHNLGSFENWAGVMGGVLSEAGIGGFMGNQSDLTGLSNGCDDELTDVAQAIADTMHGVEGSKLFVRSMTDADNGNGKFGLFDILHAMDPVPRLADWGYKEVFDGTDIDVVYSNTRSAGLRFKAAAKRTYSVMLDGKVRSVRFEIQHDTTTNSNCYTMEVS